MIFKCEKCGKEMKLEKSAKFCPECGGTVKRTDLDAKIAEMYNSGKTLKDICVELKMTAITVGQLLAKLSLDGKISDSLIQKNYENDIREVISSPDWDGKKKSIKMALPSNCSYITINYYVRKDRREKATAHRLEAEAKAQKIRDMIHEGIPVAKISEKLQASNFLVEKLLVEEISTNKELAKPYMDESHTPLIMDLVNAPDYSGNPKDLKAKLPEDITYSEIKATLASVA